MRTPTHGHPSRVLASTAAIVLGLVMAAPADAAITSRGAAARATYAAARQLSGAAPAAAVVGDQLIVAFTVGGDGGGSPPVLTPPSGWTRVNQIGQSSTALAVYRHVRSTGEAG